jgi:hypothetical protein
MTKDDFNPSPQPQENRWTAYDGGDQPVPDGTIVQVQFRDHEAVKGEFITDFGRAEDWTWRHDGRIDDIVAYRQGYFTPHPPAQSHVRAYPHELTDDLRDILSMMMWTTGPMAHALRAGGQEIKRKAEEEQAEVMHWLIGLALEHGSDWRVKASERIRQIKASLEAATTEASDNG